MPLIVTDDGRTTACSAELDRGLMPADLPVNVKFVPPASAPEIVTSTS